MNLVNLILLTAITLLSLVSAIYERGQFLQARAQLICYREAHESLLRTKGWHIDSAYTCRKVRP